MRSVNAGLGIMLLIAGFTMSSAAIDSTAIIFDDEKVHEYHLHFYTDNWQDSLEYYKDNGEQYIPARFVYVNGNDSVILDSVGVRYKGNSSYSLSSKTSKKPFKFKFDEYRSQNFFGVDKLNFSNAVKDPTQMREKLAYDIIGQYMPASRAAFAKIYVDGEMIGLYTQVEQVDKKFLKRKFVSNRYNLYKSSDNGAPLNYTTANQDDYAAFYELQTNEKINDWSALIQFIDKLNNTDSSEFVSVAGTMLDIDNCLRYLAFNMALSNFDSYTGSGRNYYLYDDSSSAKFKLIPWDLNFAFGIYTNGWNVTTVDATVLNNFEQRPLMKQLLTNDSLKQVYLSYIKQMIEGPASLSAVSEKIDKYKALIDPVVAVDSNSLNTYAQFLTNVDSDISIAEGPGKVTLPGLRSFLTKRIDNLKKQLDNYLPVKQQGFAAKHRETIAVQASRTAGETVLSVRYHLSENNSATITVFNAQGAKVLSFSDNKSGKGECIMTKRISNRLANGFYTLQVTTGSVCQLAHFVIW
ncbi:MAG TPA: CotH kinase family protein [Chitinispirillaceae bacterium]|nr:CotH kinase family protein [Chitinispirillaceae bacterium]